MKKATKIAIITALILIFAGLGICIVSAFALNVFTTPELEKSTYDISNPTDLEFDLKAQDLRFAFTDDGKARIEVYDSKSSDCIIAENDGRLSVTTKNQSRKWYDVISLYFPDTKITVFLPQTSYKTLKVNTASGDVIIPDGFTFYQAKINTVSGEVTFNADSTDSLEIKTASGDIRLSGCDLSSLKAESTSGEIETTRISTYFDIELKSVSGEIELNDAKASNITVKSTSGEVSVEGISCYTLAVKTTSGDVELENAVTSGEIKVSSTSGDIELDGCDAKLGLSLTSTSGDISGHLLSPKDYIASTKSGNVKIPKSSAGASCEIKTVSGNIYFR